MEPEFFNRVDLKESLRNTNNQLVKS